MAFAKTWPPVGAAIWTHAICDCCHQTREPFTKPVRISLPEETRCCLCGALTDSGIYFRAPSNDRALRCGGGPHVGGGHTL